MWYNFGMLPNDPLFLSQAVVRLMVAAALGAVVGLEREFKRKPAGLRTIILTAFGAALFTILSEALAAVRGGDPTRIASQLIPGIGFIGAGAIIQARGSVVGLTTAATIFVMASIGMAAGGGLYLVAVAATGLLLVFLLPIGWIERHTEQKMQPIAYRLTTRNTERCVADLQQLARLHQLNIRDLRVHRSEDQCSVEFTVEAPGGRELEMLEKIEEIRRSHG